MNLYYHNQLRFSSYNINVSQHILYILFYSIVYSAFFPGVLINLGILTGLRNGLSISSANDSSSFDFLSPSSPVSFSLLFLFFDENSLSSSSKTWEIYKCLHLKKRTHTYLTIPFNCYNV